MASFLSVHLHAHVLVTCVYVACSNNTLPSFKQNITLQILYYLFSALLILNSQLD
jgi:hypothetical protein